MELKANVAGYTPGKELREGSFCMLATPCHVNAFRRALVVRHTSPLSGFPSSTAGVEQIAIALLQSSKWSEIASGFEFLCMEVDFLVYFSSVSVRRQTWRTYSSSS